MIINFGGLAISGEREEQEREARKACAAKGVPYVELPYREPAALMEDWQIRQGFGPSESRRAYPYPKR